MRWAGPVATKVTWPDKWDKLDWLPPKSHDLTNEISWTSCQSTFKSKTIYYFIHGTRAFTSLPNSHEQYQFTKQPRVSSSLPNNQEYLPVYQTTKSTYQFTKQPRVPTSLPNNQEYLPVYQTTRSTYQFTKQPRVPTILANYQEYLPVYQTTKSTYQFNKQPGAPGVTLIAKLCIFGVPYAFVSSYAKRLNTDWTSYGSLVAVESLNTRSTSKLCVTSAMATHSSSPVHATSAVSEGQNLYDERNV